MLPVRDIDVCQVKKPLGIRGTKKITCFFMLQFLLELLLGYFISPISILLIFAICTKNIGRG